MFNPDRRAKGIGALAYDSLTIGRGEQIRPRPLSQPHHQTCPECGFDRWDGERDHRWGGAQYAQRVCFGPVHEGKKDQPPPGAVNPLVAELQQYALGQGEEPPIEPDVAPVPDQMHGFEILEVDVRKP